MAKTVADNGMKAQHQLGRFRVFFILLALVAATFLIRLGMSHSLPRVIQYDEGAYLLLGKNLLTGNGFTYSGYPEVHFPPLQPIVAGLFYLLTQDFETASNLVFVLFGALLAFPVFSIARRIYGLPAAWLSAVLLTVFPALTVEGLYSDSMSEPLFLFLLFGGLALLLAGLEDDQLWMFGAAGAFLGLAYLSRPEAVAYFGVFLVFTSIYRWKGLVSWTPRTYHSLAMFVLSFLLLAAPYIWYLHVHTGQWMITGKMHFTWAGGNRHGAKSLDEMYNTLDSVGEIQWWSQERYHATPIRTTLPDFLALTHRVITHAYQFKESFFTRTKFWWGLTPMVVIGLFSTPWSRQRARFEAFLILIVVVQMLVVLPFSSLSRYFTPIFPVLLMWTAKGSLDLGGWLQETVELCLGKTMGNLRMKSVLRWLPAGMVTSFLILSIPVAVDRSTAATAFGDKAAGLWMKTHTPVNAGVMAQELAPALYSDRRYVPSPNTDWDRFMKYARAHSANYLVVHDDFKLSRERPQLASVLRIGTPDLELVFSFEESHRQESIKTLVYRISPSHRHSNFTR